MTVAPTRTAEAYSPSDLLEMYRRMKRIRRFEERAGELYRDSEIPGFLHLSIGQEACAVGACWPLEAQDVITSNHRGHGHCLARGMDSASMFAELMGRESGTCGGRGGSMHIADPRLGVFGANGIVGAGLPIAVGAATAAKLRRDAAVVVAFFGDGAIAQGAFHESVNLAAVWDLPVIFFCENNKYAEFSSAAAQSRGTLRDRAAGYGVGYLEVDGNDVAAVARTIASARRAIIAAPRPVIVEAHTYRWHGHYEGDPERYRSADEVDEWKLSDPLRRAREALLSPHVPADAFDAVDREIEEEIRAAIDQARSAPAPDPASLGFYVIADREERPEPDPVESGEIFRTMDAVREALRYELANDPTVFLAGIDVAAGNVYGLTRGLKDAFPDRVFDTPISETALIGAAVGAAMAGMRPVVEVMYLDFIGVCFDQIMNQAAKLRYMTGGRTSLPLVIRTQFGAGQSSGSQHSQSLEALLAHIPGLTVVMPSNPAETYGLLRAAIRDPNPVIFIENRNQYGLKGPRPPADHILPLGRAAVARPGSDVTLVSYSRMLSEALAAAAVLADEGVSVEVLNLRSVAPIDKAAVLASLRKTNRMVIAHEAVRDHGLGAEIASTAVDEGFWSLDAPVIRVGAPFTPAPYTPSLEQVWLPNRDAIVDALHRVMAC